MGDMVVVSGARHDAVGLAGRQQGGLVDSGWSSVEQDFGVDIVIARLIASVLSRLLIHSAR
jgi:hypothetical protein